MPIKHESIFTAPGDCPPGWTTAPLSQYAEVVGGGTPKTGMPDFWDGDVPWATPTEITRIDGGSISATQRNITDAGLKSSNAKLLPKGALLMTSRATIGATAIAEVPMATNQGFQSLIPKDNCDVNFLQGQIQMARQRLTRLAQGSTFLEISPSTLRKVEFHWPPLVEQQRLAGLMESLDAAIEGEASVVGRLHTLMLGLLDCCLDVPPRTRFERVDAHFSLQLGKMLNEKARTAMPQLEYLGNQHVQWFEANLERLPKMNFSDAEVGKFSIQDGDVLICEGGEVGRSMVWENGSTEIKFQKAIHRARQSSGEVHPEFLVWFLFHASRHGHLSGATGKTSIAHLTRERLAALRLPVLPMHVQEQVCNTLRAVHQLVKHAEASADTKIRLKNGIFGETLDRGLPRLEVAA